MAKMTDQELLALVNAAEREAVIYNGEYMELNEDYLKYYLAQPRGDEQEDESQVISTDVFDVVESDMPSLARVFLSSSDIMVFQATTRRELDRQEAADKTAYVNWLIRHQDDSFKILFDWIKEALIQKVSTVRVDHIEQTEVEEEEYSGLSEQEMTTLVSDLEQEAERSKSELEIIGQSEEEDGGTLQFRIKRKTQKFQLVNIPPENFIISRNAKSKDDAEVIGDRSPMTKGELIAQGLDEQMVRNLPTIQAEDMREETTLKRIRYKDQGGQDDGDDIDHWVSQEVDVSNLYVLVDYDGDGIAERRHILKAGNKILVNEVFKIPPYAMLSSYLMPHSAIGRSRAEVTVQTQDIKTALYRQLLNNIYLVNHPQKIVNDEVTELDDMLAQRLGGIVRTEGDPVGAVAQLETPYIGDKALQVVQYVDSARAQTTGAQLSNQGLSSDQLYKETATRFEGVQESSEAKIELVARSMAETGFRELYKLVAWMVSKFQNTTAEFAVLGKEMTVDPRKWRGNHSIVSKVGLGAGDPSQTITNMASLLTIDQQLQAVPGGAMLIDPKKTYNKLAKIIKSMGQTDIADFYNDPDKPEEMLLAQNTQLMQALEQAQALLQQQQNPIAEAEQVRAQASLIEAQAKQQMDLAKLAQNQDQFLQKLREEARQFNQKTATERTKMELDSGKDVPGSTV